MFAILAIVFLTWLVFGYFLSGKRVAKHFELGDERETPDEARKRIAFTLLPIYLVVVTLLKIRKEKSGGELITVEG